MVVGVRRGNGVRTVAVRLLDDRPGNRRHVHEDSRRRVRVPERRRGVVVVRRT